MALKMRLRRMGRKKAPHYRIVIAESSNARDGRFVANIGHYNPTTNPMTLVVDRDKALFWLGQGATPTDTVNSLLKKGGVFQPVPEGVVENVTAAASDAAKGAGRAARGAAGAVAGAASSAAGAVSGPPPRPPARFRTRLPPLRARCRMRLRRCGRGVGCRRCGDGCGFQRGFRGRGHRARGGREGDRRRRRRGGGCACGRVG
jgi:small subunit ribosomal protein S16